MSEARPVRKVAAGPASAVSLFIRRRRGRLDRRLRRPSPIHHRSDLAATLRTSSLLLVLALSVVSARASAQSNRPTGLEFTPLPVVKLDSDEGFTYGALAELYQYGDGSALPYSWTLQPQVEMSTKGRRDLTLFFDAPRLLPEGWRVNGFLGLERRIASPFYGIGNDTPYDVALEDPDGPNPHYYQFVRLRRSAIFNLQRQVRETSLWALFGAGLVSTRVDPSPENVGTTLYATEVGPTVDTYWTNYLRAGLIWDTRDRESGPTSGSWSEVVIQWVDPSVGADVSFTRWSATDRRYYALTDRLVFANRWFLQGVVGDAPAYQLQRVQTSFKQGEGLGGSNTVRGLPKNRYAGKGMFIWNAELRWRVVDFALVGRSFHFALSSFLDQGRVWSDKVRPQHLLSDLHRGYGGGVHLGVGQNFVVSVDLAHSNEATMPFYIRLGYLF